MNSTKISHLKYLTAQTGYFFYLQPLVDLTIHGQYQPKWPAYFRTVFLTNALFQKIFPRIDFDYNKIGNIL